MSLYIQPRQWPSRRNIISDDMTLLPLGKRMTLDLRALGWLRLRRGPGGLVPPVRDVLKWSLEVVCDEKTPEAQNCR